MPAPNTVANVLTDLLGKEVEVKLGEPVTVKPNASISISIFRDDKGRVATGMICDLSFAAYTGTALAMVPAEQGDAAIRRNELPESIYDNFREVINIVGGTLFNKPGSPHLVLREVFMHPTRLSMELKPLLTDPENWLFVDTDIEDYGTGKLILLSIPED
jgi:hypothetical protein